MSGLRTRCAPLVTAGALALIGSGCAYHAGDETARNWDSWVQAHPLAGARVTDAVGTNVQPFQGSFEAYARLTAAPSTSSIVAAMASMCRFDQQTSSATTYWLQVDRLELQAPCGGDQQARVAGFWKAVHDLAGIEKVTLSRRGLDVSADDASITTLAPLLASAADATGLPEQRSTKTYASPRVKITQDRGRDISTELRLVRGVLNDVGASVKAIEVVQGRVSVSTSGSVAEARRWQADVGHGSPILTVTPARVTTAVSFSARARDLVERLSTNPRVTDIAVLKPFWTVDTPTTNDARSLVSLLDHEPGVADLGQLVLDVGTVPRNEATNTGRTCDLRPVVPEAHGRAAALLDLCDRKAAVEVDDRFAILDLRLEAPDLAGTLACLHRLPPGQEVYLQLADNSTIQFTTGRTLSTQYPDSPLAKKLSRVWATLG